MSTSWFVARRRWYYGGAVVTEARSMRRSNRSRGIMEALGSTLALLGAFNQALNVKFCMHA